MKTRWGIGIMVVAAVLLGGCFAGANVKGKHAAFHGCSADDVTVEEVDSDGHSELRTTGCGHEETYFCIGMKCRSPRLLSISKFEAKYKCKPKEIQTEPAGDLRFSLTGCGKQATYQCRQVDNHVLECDPAS